jgi:hypothetical protein
MLHCVVAKVEWHPGKLDPRVGLIVTNLTRPAECVVGFYNQRGTTEQWIKEGKNAVQWTRLSCCAFAAIAVRLQRHAPVYNLGNLMRRLALPEAVKHLPLTSLKEKVVKIGAKIVTHARYVTIQMAEFAVLNWLFAEILALIHSLRPRPAPGLSEGNAPCTATKRGVCPNGRKVQPSQPTMSRQGQTGRA